MYAVVIFENSLVIKTIPIKFIEGFDPISMANDAVNHSQTIIVFYSSNFNDSPDFDSELQDRVDEMVVGCYKARLLKFFGKYLHPKQSKSCISITINFN